MTLTWIAGTCLHECSVACSSLHTGGVVWRVKCTDKKLVCAVGSRNGVEDTKLLVLDFDVES